MAGWSARVCSPPGKGLRIFHAVLRDASGVLECAWPGQPFLDRTIEVGQTLLVSGPVRFYHGRQMAPREYLILGEADGDADPLGAGKVLPVYPATEGLSHKVIRGLVDRHLDGLIAASHDIIPERVRTAAGLPALPDALRMVHRPATVESAEEGRRRLAFDELLDLQLMLVRARALAKRRPSGGRLPDQARAHDPLEADPAVVADRRSAAGGQGDRGRHDRGRAHAPAPDG